jgi:hypothetical protein
MLRDRIGQAAALLLLTAAVATAAPGAYKAQRFDVTARAANGDLDVTESIVFEFQSGTFSRVWRDIPASRTDGIQILDAGMDGIAFLRGDGPGRFVVSGGNRVRVEWHFAGTGPSVHRFDLHYVARGVVYREGDSDVLRWTALPTEHRYAIDSSLIQLEPIGARIEAPETHRVASVRARASGEAILIDAAGIQSNGWIVADLRYPAGRLVSADPAWHTRQARGRQLAPTWAMGGAVVFIAALALILLVGQGYPSPESFPDSMPAPEPPQPLPAAVAAVLTARGRALGYQAIATLLDLADRGVLTVTEVPGVFGLRSYEIAQNAGAHDLEAHEENALETAFAGRGDNVTFSRARGRLARAGRRFADTLNEDLLRRGLVDPVRKQARDRVMTVSLACLFSSVLGAVAVAPFIPAYEAWPFLLPLGLLVAALIGLIASASMTPLSDQGLVEAARWRGFKRQLKRLAADRDERRPVPSRWIVYALAFGLGPYWARYLKRHHDVLPPWFVSAGADPGAAFATFVGSHAGGGAAGAGGGAGAAGGGGSGAG